MSMLPYSGFPALPDKMKDMHKQLVALGLNDVEALTARIKKCEDWVDNVEETELTGNPVEFQNALAVPAKSLVTEINAIQDLHGLPFPYVGGAYKNKLPLTVANVKGASTAGTWTGNKYTINGVVYELIANDDGAITDIKVTGTATADAALVLIRNWTPSAGSYILNGCPSGGSGNSYMLFTSGVTANDTGSGANMTVVNESINVACLVSNGYAIPTGGLSFKPMIRLSTESDASFAPYSNICPISGRDSVVVTRSDGDEISEDFTIQLGTTVYGADINWDTGVMTVKTAKIIMNGQGDYAPNKWATSGSHSYRWYSATIATGDYINDDSVMSSYLEKQNGEGAGVPSFAQSTSSTSQNLYIFNADMLDSSIVDTTTLCAYLQNNPLELTYKLATPATIQLTPTQLTMLKGYNRVTIEDGTITITAYTGGPWEPITRTIKKVTNKTKTTKKRRK